MKEQFISLETAKLAKKKGFKFHLDDAATEFWEPNYMYWMKQRSTKEYRLVSSMFRDTSHDIYQYIPDDNYSAPTQSLLQKWFRENHGVDVNINRYESTWSYDLSVIDIEELSSKHKFTTYEEALEAGLLNALKLIG